MKLSVHFEQRAAGSSRLCKDLSLFWSAWLMRRTSSTNDGASSGGSMHPSFCPSANHTGSVSDLSTAPRSSIVSTAIGWWGLRGQAEHATQQGFTARCLRLLSPDVLLCYLAGTVRTGLARYCPIAPATCHLRLHQESMGEGSRGPAGVPTAFPLGLRLGANAEATNSSTDPRPEAQA
jgi:hypothetical protein